MLGNIRQTLCYMILLREPLRRSLLRQGLLTLLTLLCCLPLPVHAAHQVSPVNVSSAGQVRGATTEDFRDSVASRAMAEAERLRAVWEEASLRKAIEKYLEAWTIWRAAGRLHKATSALVGAAEVHLTLSEYSQSLRYYTKAEEESRRAGDLPGELESISHIGRLYSYLGDHNRAQKYLDRALDYYSRQRRTDQSPQVARAHARTLSHIGEFYYSKGELVKAAQYFEQALGLWTEVGDTRGEARARLFTGYVKATSGERDEALNQFQRALSLSRALADRSGEAQALTAMGSIHSLKGEEQSALNLHLEARRIFHAIGDDHNEATTLNGVGQAYEDLNEKQIALDNYQQALKLSQAGGSRDLASVTVYQIAHVYRSLGDIEQALKHYEWCISLSRAAKKRRMEAYALNDMAAIYDSQGKKRKSLDQYYKILSLYRSVGDRRGQSITLNSIGDLFSSLGDEKRSLSFYQRALQPAQESGDREMEIATLYNVARAARQCGDTADAVKHVKRSVELVEALRTNVNSPQLRTSYFASVHKHYELYIDLLMQLEREQPGQGFAVAALRASEGARARSLLEILAEAGTDIRRGIEASLLERERALQQQLLTKAQQQMELSSSGQTHAEADQVALEIRQLTTEYQAVQARMREQSPRYNTLTQPRQLSLDEIQAALGDENSILLEYALGEERSYLWAVTSHSFDSYELPARATLEESAREVYNLLTVRQTVEAENDAGYGARVETADRQYRERALNLSRMLLGPVAGRLGGKKLLIVTEGALQYIPLDALPAPLEQSAGNSRDDSSPALHDETLIVSRNEVVTLPSISTLIGIRRERTRESLSGKVVSILADPVFSKRDSRLHDAGGLRTSAESADTDDRATRSALRNFRDSGGETNIPRLRHAAKEAEAIIAAAPRGAWMLATGFDAHRETAMSDVVGQSRIVHFATHGLVNSEHPELSGIILSMINERGEQKNGFLQLHDIYNLNLSADLVVLSACDTGLGKNIKGEGLVGLTRGFMYAGSKGVIASLWKVDDRATAELMGYFYKALLQEGLPPAAALRSAKQAMRRHKTFAAPYYWAAFQLQGEFAGRIEVGSGVWPVTAAVLVLTLIVASFCLGVLIVRRVRGS